jgi:hypothetical protein
MSDVRRLITLAATRNDERGHTNIRVRLPRPLVDEVQSLLKREGLAFSSLLSALLQGYVEGSTSALQLVEQWIQRERPRRTPGDVKPLSKKEISALYSEIGEPEGDDVKAD